MGVGVLGFCERTGVVDAAVCSFGVPSPASARFNASEAAFSFNVGVPKNTSSEDAGEYAVAGLLAFNRSNRERVGVF